MMCVFCGNREKCWDKLTDEELEMEWVKCGYDDYVLDDSIELEYPVTIKRYTPVRSR